MSTLSYALLSQNIDDVAKYDLVNKKVFGSAYCVYHNGHITQQCYGSRTPNAADTVTDTTVFRLASMTKPITTVATMILVERGLLSLNDTLDRFFPAFKSIQIITAAGECSTPQKLPTIKHILTHSSGIGSDPEKMQRMTDQDRKDLDSTVAFCLRSGLDFEPDSKQQYSGTAAFDVLTRIIELVTNTDFLTFLKKEIFDPCGMQDTTFIPNDEQKARMTEMHCRQNGENAVFAMPNGCVFESVPCTHYLGGAGLVSTLRDYCKFAKMLLHYGKTDTTRILSEDSVKLLCQPQFYKTKAESWGLGMRVITDDSYPYLPKGTFGWSGAYGSHFWVDHSNNVFAVFMKNSKVDGGAANESARNFEKAVYSSFVTE